MNDTGVWQDYNGLRGTNSETLYIVFLILTKKALCEAFYSKFRHLDDGRMRMGLRMMPVSARVRKYKNKPH